MQTDDHAAPYEMRLLTAQQLAQLLGSRGDGSRTAGQLDIREGAARWLSLIIPWTFKFPLEVVPVPSTAVVKATGTQPAICELDQEGPVSRVIAHRAVK